MLALHVAKPVVARKKNSRQTFSFCRSAQLPGSSSLARVRRASYLEPQHFRSRVLDCITTPEAVWLPSAGRSLVSICRFVRDRVSLAGCSYLRDEHRREVDERRRGAPTELRACHRERILKARRPREAHAFDRLGVLAAAEDDPAEVPARESRLPPQE